MTTRRPTNNRKCDRRADPQTWLPGESGERRSECKYCRGRRYVADGNDVTGCADANCNEGFHDRRSH